MRYRITFSPTGSYQSLQDLSTSQMWVAAKVEDSEQHVNKTGKFSEIWVDVMDCHKSPMLLFWRVPRKINGKIVW